MLPLPVLDIVAHHLSSPDMAAYLQLAQVDRKFREYFMSDWAWRRFDVHSTRNAPVSLCARGGVARHYLEFLAALEPTHRAWHLSGGLENGQPEWNDPYDHLFRLCTMHERSDLMDKSIERGTERSRTLSFDRQFRDDIVLVPQSVWTLYLQYQHPATKWKLHPLCYAHLLSDAPMCMALLPRVHDVAFDISSSRFHRDNWDVSLECEKQSAPWGFYTSDNLFQTDKKFLLAMVRQFMDLFGKYELFYESTFFSEVLAQNPGLLDYLADHWPQFRLKRVWRAGHLQPIPPIPFARLPLALRSHARVVHVALSFEWLLGDELKHVSNELQDNENVVARAVGSSPKGLKYASRRLRDDKDLVLCAIKLWPKAWKYASLRLKLDPEILAHNYVYAKRISCFVGDTFLARTLARTQDIKHLKARMDYAERCMSTLPFKRRPLVYH